MKEENEDKTVEVSESDNNNGGREEVHTTIVRAGNRTYFFDVKATRKSDLYITLTESKKRFNKDGKFFFEKHKIFLYKEDFEKFAAGLEEAINFIRDGKFEGFAQFPEDKDNDKDQTDEIKDNEFINVDFEDLGEK